MGKDDELSRFESHPISIHGNCDSCKDYVDFYIKLHCLILTSIDFFSHSKHSCIVTF